MAFEKYWAQIPAVLFTADGKDNGEITVDNACQFKVGQIVVINSTTQPDQRLKIKRIPSYNVIVVGPVNGNIKSRLDVSDYTLADISTIRAEEQNRPSIPKRDMDQATFEEEPTIAWRSFLVDRCGNGYTTKNPFPVQLSDGNIDIGTVNAELEVQLSHKDNYPDAGDIADSVQVGDGKDILAINDDGSINVVTEISLPNNEGIDILSMVSSSNEYSFTFPNGTKNYRIKARNHADVIKVGLSSGDIAGGKYWTIDRGNDMSPEGDNDFPDNYTLYFSSKSKNNIDLEIHYWYKS